MRLSLQEVREAASRRGAQPPRSSFEEALERSVSATPGGAPRPAPLALPELREALQAVPPAIWAGRLSDGVAVELSFGDHVTVELRQVPGGIELEVRASAALERAARSDLPALVEALRARGVTVVRAGVRGGAVGGRRQRERGGASR